MGLRVETRHAHDGPRLPATFWLRAPLGAFGGGLNRSAFPFLVLLEMASPPILPSRHMAAVPNTFPILMLEHAHWWGSSPSH